MEIITGKIWKFGDNIDTDQIIPSQYVLMDSIEEMTQHAFEPLDPCFSEKVKEGNIIVAGKNFGCGSSREQAPAVLKKLGIKAIIAKSFARIFYRNCINKGIFVLVSKKASDGLNQGKKIKIVLKEGIIQEDESGKIFEFDALPEFILEMIESGGIIEHTHK